MNELKREMIQEAREQYDTIIPCGANNDLDQCFMQYGGKVLFWFNTTDRSTHVIVAEAA